MAHNDATARLGSEYAAIEGFGLFSLKFVG